MDDSLLIQPKVSFQLDLPPSCIQFCKAHPRYFVVGTYNLEKEEPQGEAAHSDKKAQTRNGSLIICTVDEDNVSVGALEIMHYSAREPLTPRTGPSCRPCCNHPRCWTCDSTQHPSIKTSLQSSRAQQVSKSSGLTLKGIRLLPSTIWRLAVAKISDLMSSSCNATGILPLAVD